MGAKAGSIACDSARFKRIPRVNLGDMEPIRSLAIPVALAESLACLLRREAWVASEDRAGQVAEAVEAIRVARPLNSRTKVLVP